MTSSSLDDQRPSSSFSSPFSTSRRTYDVFLSFRGPDTRNTFVAHLYEALRRRGIKIYIDDMLRRGDDISPAVLYAIEVSMVSIVVLSRSYPSSTWCLDELMKILECKETKQQMVLPVFYRVDPSEVRKQTKNFGKALADLEKRFKNDLKVQRWREALTKVANVSGFHWTKERNESEFVMEIVERVSRSTTWRRGLYLAKFPIGLESRVRDIISLLNIESHDMVQMVGILGIGGIGKTTVAKAVYNSIFYQFDGSCFLLDVKTISKKENVIAHLQEKLLSEILGDSTLKVENEDQGVNEIKNILCLKRVLLVLDDVDESKQLEKLAGACDWFGLGSRIVITTREKHLLDIHGVNSQYMIPKLNHNEAFKLFSWHAFHRDRPDDDCVAVTKDILQYVAGLPLALSILGSDLYGSNVQQWKSALEYYKQNPHQDIQEILKRSYERLDSREKDIFLDIACFFVGDDVKYVIKILDNCDRFIQKFIDKCLVRVDFFGKLRMHNLLQDTGKEIVRQESKEPGERSRLWNYEDVRHILENNTGTNKVEGIVIEFPERDQTIHLSSEVFRKMTRLRLFINRNAYFSEGPNFLSNELRVLDWPKYPLQFLPTNFRGEKLVCLNMHHSQIKELKTELMKNLTYMDFSNCKFLKKIPDLSRNKDLTHLPLDACINLVEVHSSIGFLDKLQVLSLKGCSSLSDFPRRLELPSLQSLELSGCSSLEYFPEIGCEMKEMKTLILRHNGTKELPSSIGSLTGLEHFEISECKNLIGLPDSICELSKVRDVSFRGSRIMPPAWINRVWGLGSQRLSYAGQLEEIPPNIREVFAGDWKSLRSFAEDVVKIFYYNRSDIQKLNWIGLSGSHKMLVKTENHVPRPDPDQDCYDHSWGIVFPGNRIPGCFCVCEGDGTPSSYEIQMEMIDADKIAGVAVCVVIGPVPASTQLGLHLARLTIQGSGFISRFVERQLDPSAWDSDHHVWLEYLTLRPSLHRDGDCILRISIDSDNSDELKYEKLGVYLVYKNAESAEYHAPPTKKLKIEEIY